MACPGRGDGHRATWFYDLVCLTRKPAHRVRDLFLSDGNDLVHQRRDMSECDVGGPNGQ